MFDGDCGYGALLDDGYVYAHIPMQSYVAQETARRAAFAKFQSYPLNSVAGGGTLVKGGKMGLPGFMWHEFQPPQVYQHMDQILADMLGGGIDTGSLVPQPLISG